MKANIRFTHENRIVTASLVKNLDEEQMFFKVANTERSMVTTINFREITVTRKSFTVRLCQEVLFAVRII